MRGTHEFHENWATTNSNDSTVSKMVDSAIINATGDSEPVDDGNRHHKLNNTHISEENYDLCTLEAVSEENIACSIFILKVFMDIKDV